MALQTSGPISIDDIATEFGGTTPHSLGEYYGVADGIPASGEISISSFYGKSSVFSFTISSDTADADVASLATSAGWDGSTALAVTINSGVFVYGSTTTTPALTVSGSFPSGLTITNNGYIVGDGGNGGNGGYAGSNGSAGGAGGKAMDVSSSVTIINNGTIAGGGGGGGGGGGFYNSQGSYRYGGGGGGGRTGLVNSSGGSGHNTGGAGTSSAAGDGGAGYVTAGEFGGVYGSGSGGDGGEWGSNGSAGSSAVNTANISGTTTLGSGGAGGPAGACLTGNSYVTWSVTGTRLGSIS